MAMTETPDPKTHELESDAVKVASRRGVLIALPSWVYLTVFFAVPLVIVIVYSFATRSSTGLTRLTGWNIDSYRRLLDPLVGEIAIRSLVLAVATTHAPALAAHWIA